VRGVTRIFVRSASTLPGRESTQPKQIASSQIVS